MDVLLLVAMMLPLPMSGAVAWASRATSRWSSGLRYPTVIAASALTGGVTLLLSASLVGAWLIAGIP